MPINTRPKSPNELEQFTPLVIKEIHRLYNCSSNGNIEIIRTNTNRLDELTREELLKVLKKPWKESHSFEFEEKNFPERKLKNPEKKFYDPDPPLFEDYVFIHPSEDQPVYLRIKPNFIDIYPQQKKSETPSSLKLPANTRWEDITIKFFDQHNVDIKCKDKTIRSDYKKMGFEDSKSRRVNKQWEMLYRLAENDGEISWDKSTASKNSDFRKTVQDYGNEYDNESSSLQNKGFTIIKAPDKLKKTKQLLAQTLKTYFQIDEDPFWPYSEVKAYKIKIKLIS